jgi:para-nitrobenzyl esterase
MNVKIRASAACAALVILQLVGCGGGSNANPVMLPIAQPATQPVTQPDASIPPADTPATQRDTTFGAVIGADDSVVNGTFSWKGIPFAKAPVGDLRWKAPADPQAWSSPRTTQQFGNPCVQTQRLYGPGSNNRLDVTVGTTLGQTVGSEDCLYLNVWQPSTPSATARPVIVFVHGGSNISGYTADPHYDGAALAKTADAVVVTVNYRVGIFGFLDATPLKTGDAAESSGNFALLDLVKALKFVNANIAAFGGDPRNVTLMGHSAGAMNVLALLTSPLVINANPALFQRAMPLSGGISLASNLPVGTSTVLSPNTSSQAQGSALVASLVIADGLATDAASAQTYIAGRTPAQLADYLRSKSPNTLQSIVWTRLAAVGLWASNPIPEGTVLPTDPIGAIKAGRYFKVPVLAGYTRDEGRLFASTMALSPALGGVSERLIDDATVFSIISNYHPDAAPTTTVEQWIPAVYLPAGTPVTGFVARTDLLTRNLFHTHRDDALNALKSQQPAVWAWQFDWDELPAPFDTIYGAAHGFDLPFMFGNFGVTLYANITNTTANRPGRLALSQTMMKSIGAFARNGDPNNAALGTTWPAWPSQLVFDGTAAGATISVR